MIPGDELIDRLARLIASQEASDDVKISGLEAVGGGYSLRTHKFCAAIDGRPTTLVSRSEPPADQVMVDSDRGIEWAVLRHLTDLGAPFVAPARWYDADGAVMGARTIISDFVEGPTMASLWPTAGVEQRHRFIDAIVDVAASIATFDTTGMDPVVDRPPSWEVYMASMIDLWRRAEASFVERNPFLRYVASWLEANTPKPAPLALVHGDFQTPNIMVTRAGPVVVDWEFPHIGDIREDLGWLRMIDKFMPEPVFRGNEERILARFRERTGLGEDVINEEAVTYFSVMVIQRVYTMLYDQMRAMARGENTSIKVAYSSCVNTISHDDWLRMILESDPADIRSNQ